MIVDFVHSGAQILAWLIIFHLIAYHYPTSIFGKVLIFAN